MGRQYTEEEMIEKFGFVPGLDDYDYYGENDYVLMTREYLCKCMDIEVNEGNMNYIGSMCNVLFKLGHIDIEVEDVVEFIDGKRVPKTYNWFRLTTQKEWEEKSKKKKRKRKNS